MCLADFDAVGISAIITALGTLVVALSGVIVAILKDRRERKEADAKTDSRVDLLWERDVRRGRVEARQQELLHGYSYWEAGILNSEARRAFDPIAPALRELRRELGDHISEGKYAEEIERRFGAWLAEYICPVLGVTNYACLEMARIVALEKAGSDTAHPPLLKSDTP